MKYKTVIVSLCVLFMAGCTQQTTNSPTASPTTSESLNTAATSSSPSGSAYNNSLLTSSPQSSRKATASPRAATQTKSPSPTPQKSSATSSSNPTSVPQTNVANSTQPTSSPATRTSTPAATQQNTGTVTVSTNSITQTVNRSQESGGSIKLEGFTLTSQGATAYQVNLVNQSSAFNTSGVSTSGGTIPGTSRTIWLNLNSQTIPNGTYTQTLLINYTKNGVDYSGPTITYTVTLEGNTTTSKLSTSTQTVNETLSRANQSRGSILGNGFTITSNGADGFDLVVSKPSNLTASHFLDFGPSGGSLTNGQTVSIQPYVNTALPNGTYSGTVLVRYSINHLYTEGPIQINYTLTVAD
jgi:hypothetical protein